MRFRKIYVPILAIGMIGFLTLLSSATPKNLEGDYNYLKQRLGASKAFTLEVIKAMPEDKYDFRPDEGVRTFKETVYHIVYSVDYYRRVFGGNPNAAWSPGKEDSKSKEELITWANEQFDEMEKVIMAAPNNPQLTAGIVSYLDHNSHHRGALIIYLRMSGIAAPSYR